MSNNQQASSKDLFLQFVFGLMQSGMMQLGKIVNPVTGKIEKDLSAAQSTIDLLMMLREKTRGNLDKTESDMLNNAISTLQLNYVDEIESATKGAGEASSDKPASSATAENKSA